MVFLGTGDEWHVNFVGKLNSLTTELGTTVCSCFSIALNFHMVYVADNLEDKWLKMLPRTTQKIKLEYSLIQ
tara:strand:+ start:872 stop:1087 length:216 start_codon:yes stop_codon:yes gene_type:complete